GVLLGADPRARRSSRARGGARSRAATCRQRGGAARAAVVTRRKLPLASPNWRPIGETLKYCRERTGHHELADLDVAAAVNDGRLGTKIEQFNRRTGERKTTLLSAKLRRDHELTLWINN